MNQYLQTKIIIILLIMAVVLIIAGSSFFAKSLALKCPKCGVYKCKKTGRQEEINRPEGAFWPNAPLGIKYEYQCPKCKHVFWSSIESIL